MLEGLLELQVQSAVSMEGSLALDHQIGRYSTGRLATSSSIHLPARATTTLGCIVKQKLFLQKVLAVALAGGLLGLHC